MTDTTTPRLDRNDILAAREAGASGLFLMVAALDPDAVGVEFNYTGRELARATADADSHAERVEAAEAMIDRKGHFITALWNGDLAEALYRADGRNTRLLVRSLDRELLLAYLQADRGAESAERYLSDVEERYGWDAE